MKNRLPIFSVIIPTYNRPDQLALCLNAITRIEYPYNRFEVIVVDDGSSVDLKVAVEPFYSQLPLTLIRQRNSGPGTARNKGVASAKGDYLAFIDDDCTPAQNWLQVLAMQLKSMPDRLIGGRVLNSLTKNIYSEASQQLLLYLYGYYNSDVNNAQFFTSNNMVVPIECFRTIGGFDVTFPLAAGEDRVFCARWLSCGYKMAYVPEAVVYHAHNMSMLGFWRQHFNYGRGAYCFHLIRLGRNEERVKLEPLTFYINLLLYPFQHSFNVRSFFLALLFFCSQISNTMGYFWEKIDRLITQMASRKKQKIKKIS